MKCAIKLIIGRAIRQSPSMRREWIEISIIDYNVHHLVASPSMRREWIEMCHLWW